MDRGGKVMFRKSDLKSGMRVTPRDGSDSLVLLNTKRGDILVDINEPCIMSLDSYDNNFKYEYDELESPYDILKIESPMVWDCLLKSPEMETLYEAEDVLKVTMKDIEEKFGCKVKIVEEEENSGN
jgi:hypothetical protein